MNSAVPATMRAAVLHGVRDLRVEDVPIPEIGPADVLVEVAMCGTCGTDVGILDRPLPGQPPYGSFIPGHEWTGTVVALGETVDEVGIGQRVAIHVHHGCGRCVNCLRGSYTACLNYGIVAKGHRASGLTVSGGFAQYVAHLISSVHPIGPAVSWEDAVLATTAGTAVYGLDRVGGLVAGDTVAIVGPGPVGLMALQVVCALGAGITLLLGTRNDRLDLGKQLGADHTIHVGDEDPVDGVLERTGGRGVNLVIETSGNGAMPDRALRMVRRGGTVLFLAFYGKPVAFDVSYANLSEINLVTSRGEGRAAVRRSLVLTERGLVRGRDLVTHRYPLEEIQRGFDDLRERRGDPMKVVFVP